MLPHSVPHPDIRYGKPASPLPQTAARYHTLHTEVYILHRIRLRKTETILVVVPVRVIRIDTITAFCCSQIKPRKHDAADVGGVSIEPPFACLTIKRFSKVDLVIEGRGVRAPILVTARRKVADYFSSPIVKIGDGGSVVVEYVKVIDRGIEGGIGERMR